MAGKAAARRWTHLLELVTPAHDSFVPPAFPFPAESIVFDDLDRDEIERVLGWVNVLAVLLEIAPDPGFGSLTTRDGLDDVVDTKRRLAAVLIHRDAELHASPLLSGYGFRESNSGSRQSQDWDAAD